MMNTESRYNTNIHVGEAGLGGQGAEFQAP